MRITDNNLLELNGSRRRRTYSQTHGMANDHRRYFYYFISPWNCWLGSRIKSNTKQERKTKKKCNEYVRSKSTSICITKQQAGGRDQNIIRKMWLIH